MRLDLVRYTGTVIITDLISAVDLKIVRKSFTAKLPADLVIIKYAACEYPFHLIDSGVRHQKDRTDIIPGRAETQPDPLPFRRLGRYHIGRSPITEQCVSAHPEISFLFDRFTDLFRIFLCFDNGLWLFFFSFYVCFLILMLLSNFMLFLSEVTLWPSHTFFPRFKKL